MEAMKITQLEYLRLIKAPPGTRFSTYLSDNPTFPHSRINEKLYEIDVYEAITWLSLKNTSEDEKDTDTFDYQKLRKLTLEADALHRTKLLDEDILRDTSKIIKDVTTEYSRVRSKLLALPSRLSPKLFSKSVGKIEKILDQDIRDTLEELSKHD